MRITDVRPKWQQRPRTNYRETVQDGEIVAAIVAGDPAGLAAAYDNYAPGLYAYCRTLLTEPADAADAVQDSYVIAAAKLAGLRDPDRLRPWLYAVTRNECYRRLRARGLSAPLDVAVVVTSDEPGVRLSPDREELRGLVVDALAGLNPSDREIIELNLRHVLDGEDLADALGVSRNHAQALASRARAQFEGLLGALLVARAGREQCQELDGILAGGDGELTILVRKRVNRHIERCQVCGQCKRRELSPAMLLSMLPMVALPYGLREQVLRLVDDVSPVAAGHRELVARRAEPFDRSGFPKPVAAPRRVYGAQALTVAACVAAAAAILLGAGTILVLGALHHKGAPIASAATVKPSSVSQAPLNSGSTPVAPSSPSHKSGGGKHIGLTITVSGSPSASASGPSGTSPGGSSPAPGRSSRPPSPTPSPPPSPSPSPGMLQVSTGSVTLTQNPDGTLSGSFSLTAQGGDVSYSIVNPSPGLSVAPGAGSLPSGQSVTISLSAASAGDVSAETDLTVSPGGLTVAVLVPGA
jgi:RNA polymerase sigma factor (sigma-70 family)